MNEPSLRESAGRWKKVEREKVHVGEERGRIDLRHHSENEANLSSRLHYWQRKEEEDRPELKRPCRGADTLPR
jgi:hypothetical protein